MGFLTNGHWHAARSASADTTTQKRPPAWDPFWFTPSPGYVSSSGQRVSADRALTVPPFWRGVRILSENVGSFKLRVYEQKKRGHGIANDHPYARTLGLVANPDLTAFEFWETMVAHVVLRGRAFARKILVPDVRRQRQRLELWPLHPDRVKVTRTPSRTLTYEVRDENGGPPVKFGTDEIFHLRGLGFDGIDGAPMVAYATNSIGGMLAAEAFAQRFFKVGVTAALSAIHPQTLDDDGIRNLRDSVTAYLTSLENAYGVFVGDEGVVLNKIGVEPEDAQLLQTREMSAKHAALWLGLPPGMLGETQTPTYASSKQFRQDLVDLTFRPLTERLEARIDMDLLADEAEPDRYFSKFAMDSLVRGDISERYKAHQIAIASGFMTRNEVRLREDLEPLDGLDEPIYALNMGTGEEGQGEAGGGRAQRPRRTDRALERASQIVLLEAHRLVRKEVAAVTRLAQRHASDGGAWQAGLREFYEKHAEEVAERLGLPAVAAREYAARQGLRLEARGLAACEDWERTLPVQLAAAALEPDEVAGRLTALES